jgi:DhnA family fructose-bisphosphate aldolase class Ia
MLTYTHKEEYSIVTYDIEIYCKQMTIDGVVTPAKKVARILAEEIDAVITSTLGLVRTLSPADAPYEVDTSVSRKILTYEGILDLTNDYIYNRR